MVGLVVWLGDLVMPEKNKIQGRAIWSRSAYIVQGIFKGQRGCRVHKENQHRPDPPVTEIRGCLSDGEF